MGCALTEYLKTYDAQESISVQWNEEINRDRVLY